MRGRESVYVTSPGKMSSVDAQGGQRCGRRVLQRHPDLNPCLWLSSTVQLPANAAAAHPGCIYRFRTSRAARPRVGGGSG